MLVFGCIGDSFAILYKRKIIYGFVCLVLIQEACEKENCAETQRARQIALMRFFF